MEKFVLSKTCRLLDFNALKIKNTSFPDEVAVLEKEEAFILEKGSNRFMINPTIKFFLEYFEQPTSLNTVLGKIVAQVQCKKEDIESPIDDFFQQMTFKNILISEATFNKQQKVSDPTIPSIDPDTIIEGYKFIERIFVNSKIEIYKVLSLSNNKTCAAKILRKDRVNSKMVKIFYQEFELLKALGSHNHICKMIDLIETDEKIFGLLEFVDGLSGRKYINKSVPSPSLDTRLKVLSQFFDGMAFIHSQAFTHGDIHLSNLMIDKNDYLKIIDFNMSNRAVPQENEVVHEGGVYQYIAPEKVNDQLFKIVNSPASFPSEVYQMGVIAYFFLYEKMPFTGFSWKALSQAILNENPVFEEFTPNEEAIPISVIKFVKKMLSKVPENRFPNAAEASEAWKRQQLKV